MKAAGRQSAQPGVGTRLGYLEEVADRLWPPPAAVTLGRGGPSGHVIDEFILLPHARRPRLLVPIARHTAATAVRHYAGHESVPARLRNRALSWVLATGLGATGMRDRLRVHGPVGAATIETYLQQVLRRDVQVSMHIGPPRANRKPVLQLLADDGRTVGFAKVGINALTQDLVRAEWTALTDLERAGLRHVAIPRVRHYGRWHDLDILVLDALPTWRGRRRPGHDRLVEAAWEIARVGGIRRHRLADSPYWRSLRSRLDRIGDDGASRVDRAALDAAASAVSVRSGDEDLVFGSWHGDWAPWNMAAVAGGLLVWDWERFESGVPVGFDVLHHFVQTAVVRRQRPPGLAAAECVEGAARLLEPFGLGSRQARLVAVLYLMEIAVRYRLDGQSEAGARLGDLGSWLLPVLGKGVTEL